MATKYRTNIFYLSLEIVEWFSSKKLLELYHVKIELKPIKTENQDFRLQNGRFFQPRHACEKEDLKRAHNKSTKSKTATMLRFCSKKRKVANFIIMTYWKCFSKICCTKYYWPYRRFRFYAFAMSVLLFISEGPMIVCRFSSFCQLISTLQYDMETHCSASRKPQEAIMRSLVAPSALDNGTEKQSWPPLVMRIICPCHYTQESKSFSQSIVRLWRTSVSNLHRMLIYDVSLQMRDDDVPAGMSVVPANLQRLLGWLGRAEEQNTM